MAYKKEKELIRDYLQHRGIIPRPQYGAWHPIEKRLARDLNIAGWKLVEIAALLQRPEGSISNWKPKLVGKKVGD